MPHLEFPHRESSEPASSAKHLVSARAAIPAVSVVVPCYKQAQFLAEAVSSVLEQTYPDWEIVIVNDGSPDDTSRVAQEIIGRNPDYPIRLIEKANGGLADARNAGIRFARGRYILPLDADDRIHPEALAKMVALLEREPRVAIAYCDWQYFGAETRTRCAIDWDVQRLCTKENLFTCTSLFRKQLWNAVGGFNRNMTHGVEDWDFWIGCAERGFVGQRIPEVLFYYRAKPDSMIHRLQPHLPPMFARIILNHPRIYGQEAVANAREVFAKAKLPPAKPSSPGVEWSRPPGVATPESGQARATSPVAVSAAGVKPATCFAPAEITAIETWAKLYRDNADPTAEQQLLQARERLVKYLLESERETVEREFPRALAAAFRTLRSCGLGAGDSDGATRAANLIAGLVLAEMVDVRPLLAALLLRPAHLLNVPAAIQSVPAWCLDEALACYLAAPQGFAVAGEAEQYVEHLTRVAESVLRCVREKPAGAIAVKLAMEFATHANCIPAYVAHANTTVLMRHRAEIIEFILAKHGAMLDLPPAPRSRAKRIRVGFVCAHFGRQTETHVTLPALHLDRSRFEVWLFPLATDRSSIEARCRSLADHFVPLPPQTSGQVKTVRDAQMDVVIIGTNITAVTNPVLLLAAHRLAPLQLVSYCSPMTTGLRHVDGYLYGSLSQFKGVQEHFTEELIVCDGAPGCLDYTTEPAASMRFDRKSLGIADDEVVFINAASCFKIPVELQRTWARILQKVERSRLLLLPFNPNWSSNFPARLFSRTVRAALRDHGLAEDRAILVRPLASRADVKELEKVADVYLDTFPFSGSLSVIDPLEIGVPVVTCQGMTPRSRAAASLLRAIEADELVAPNEAAYVERAVRLGIDFDYRRHWREVILERMAKRPKFLDPVAYGRDLSDKLEERVRRANSDATGVERELASV